MTPEKCRDRLRRWTPPVIGCLCALLLLTTGCGDPEPTEPEPGQPAPRKISAEERTGLVLPKSGRYQQFLELPPSAPDNAVVLLARFDLLAAELPELAAKNPHLPGTDALEKNDSLVKMLHMFSPKARWWQLGTLFEPTCAHKAGQKIPTRPKKKPDAGDVSTPPVPIDDRTWRITLCVGNITTNRVRVYVLLVEEKPLPLPAPKTLPK